MTHMLFWRTSDQCYKIMIQKIHSWWDIISGWVNFPILQPYNMTVSFGKLISNKTAIRNDQTRLESVISLPHSILYNWTIHNQFDSVWNTSSGCNWVKYKYPLLDCQSTVQIQLMVLDRMATSWNWFNCSWYCLLWLRMTWLIL